MSRDTGMKRRGGLRYRPAVLEFEGRRLPAACSMLIAAGGGVVDGLRQAVDRVDATAGAAIEPVAVGIGRAPAPGEAGPGDAATPIAAGAASSAGLLKACDSEPLMRFLRRLGVEQGGSRQAPAPRGDLSLVRWLAKEVLRRLKWGHAARLARGSGRADAGRPPGDDRRGRPALLRAAT